MNLGIWARIINTALGIWLMAAPAVLGYGAPASANDRVVGPIVVTFAVVAMWEATRAVRRVNLLLGLWMLIAPWVLGYELVPILNSSIVGVLVMAFASVHGRTQQRYGGGWTALWRS